MSKSPQEKKDIKKFLERVRKQEGQNLPEEEGRGSSITPKKSVTEKTPLRYSK